MLGGADAEEEGRRGRSGSRRRLGEEEWPSAWPHKGEEAIGAGRARAARRRLGASTVRTRVEEEARRRCEPCVCGKEVARW